MPDLTSDWKITLFSCCDASVEAMLKALREFIQHAEVANEFDDENHFRPFLDSFAGILGYMSKSKVSFEFTVQCGSMPEYVPDLPYDDGEVIDALFANVAWWNGQDCGASMLYVKDAERLLEALNELPGYFDNQREGQVAAKTFLTNLVAQMAPEDFVVAVIV